MPSEAELIDLAHRMRILVLVLFAGACSKSSRDAAAPFEALRWDSAVGWERPGDDTSHTRDPATYLDVEDVLSDPQLMKVALTALPVGLANRTLIVKPATLCDPTLQAVVAEARPSRLLLRIDGTLTPEAVACLSKLATPRLYLGMCPDDGATLWHCDGNAELAALTANATLAPRIVALGIWFGDATLWRNVRALQNLEYLAVRGPAVGDVDPANLHAICARPTLASLDVLDPEHGSGLFDRSDCAWGRISYMGMDVPAPRSGVPCRLRRLIVWDHTAERADSLRAACQGLSELDSVREHVFR